jgi:hypothetical protein
MTARYHSTRPDRWTDPRPTADPRKCSPVLPMEPEQARFWKILRNAKPHLYEGKRHG